MHSDSLKQFRKKRTYWIKCFSGDDGNSIINQIYRMIWNAAVFKVIDEARRSAAINKKNQAEVNEMLHHCINDCFFDSQLLAIRRLIDSSSIRGKKGVFSLHSLISDMKEHINMFTRHNLLVTEGLKYKRNKNNIITKASEQSKKIILKNRNEDIDILSCVKNNHHSPSDTIDARVFDWLIEKIENVPKNIKIYVDKYIAHAASKESRKHYKADKILLKFKHFWNTHKVICQVVNFIDIYILATGYHYFLPTPQYNQFEFIDKPLISTEGVKTLSKAWDEFDEETKSWGSLKLEDFQKEIT